MESAFPPPLDWENRQNWSYGQSLIRQAKRQKDLHEGRDGSQAEDARIAHAVTRGKVRHRGLVHVLVQRQDTHLTHVSIRVANPDIGVRWQGGTRARELQSSPRFPDGHRVQELRRWSSVHGLRQSSLCLHECGLEARSFVRRGKDDGQVVHSFPVEGREATV